MKQLTCEMCGGTDLIKQDGVFICQNCGMKYSVEEAKKMMIEGTVEVQGTIKIDNSKELDNYISLAKIALEGNDSDGVIKNAGKILELDSNRYEGYYFMAKTAGWDSTLKDPKLDKAIAYAKRAIAQAQNKEEIASDIYNSLKAQIFGLLRNAVGLPSESGAYVWRIMKEWINVIVSIPSLPVDLIKEEYSEIKKLSTCKKNIPNTSSFEDRLPVFVKSGITLYNNSVPYHVMLLQLLPADVVKKCGLETEIQSNTSQESTSNSKDSGGCYVATAVYGSYDCPEVWTLRRYRDNTLAETWHGRAFIRTYYAVSPTLVKWFGHTEWFKKMWKGTLDRMVSRLNADGVADTPYEDKHW